MFRFLYFGASQLNYFEDSSTGIIIPDQGSFLTKPKGRGNKEDYIKGKAAQRELGKSRNC